MSDEVTIWPPLCRSQKLFNFDPLATGEPTCESATSWFVRQAREHRCRPGTLVQGVIIPSTHLSSGWSADRRKFAHLLNGSTRCASEIANAVSELSGSSVVRYHSLVFLSDVLDSKGKFALDDRRKWCCECMRAQLVANEPSHDHLYWALRTVRICAIHLTELRFDCPKCNAVQRHIPRIPSLTVCELCGESLIADDGSNGTSSALANSQALIWHARAAASLMRAGYRRGTASFETLRSNLDFLLGQHAGGSVARLAAMVGMREQTLRNWFRERTRPCLLPFAEFSYRLQIPLESLLFDRTLALTDPSQWIVGSPIRFAGISARSTPLDRERYLEALRDALNRPLEDRPTLKDVAASLGVSPSLIVSSFRQEAKLLTESTRVRNAQEAQERQRQRTLNRQIAERQIAQEGHYPSHRRLKQTGLVKPSDLRRKNSDRAH